MMDQENSGRLNEAIKAFESFRRRREGGETLDLDALCAQHPELEDNLRFLNSVYLQGHTAAPTVTIRDVIKEHLGEDAAERFALETDEDERAHGDTDDDLGDEPGDRYLRKAEVGRGGMSRVLSVWDREFRRTLAMKVSLSNDGARFPSGVSSARSESIERLFEEALVTSQLDHPGIVPVYDVGVDRDGHGYFTMRLVKGDSFRKIIGLARRNEKGWSLPRSLEALSSACETVAFAHARGVIHRDLKPANIMVSRFAEPYVIDWGLAKILGKEDRHAMRLRFASPTTLVTVETRRTGRSSEDPEDPLATPAGTVVGTPVYMPPEQAGGRVEAVNQTSDVYSLGALLYTLLAGRPPYVPPDGKASPLSILGRVIEGPPLPIRDIDPEAPRALVRICEKAMARVQADRYPDALELAGDLRAYVERGGHRLSGARRDGVAAANRSRRRAWTLVITLMGITLIGVAGYLIGLHSGEAREVTEERVLERLQELETLEREAERRLVRKRTVEDMWPRWQQAVTSIADPEDCPDYDRLVLEPQQGIVPLGKDPSSGLWEFGHLQTGSIPRRRPGGALERTPENGLVFVLIPESESLEPFFFSKYRMTRAQWKRVNGETSSAGEDHRPLDPVADVTWAGAEKTLRRLELTLPTIAQWERATTAAEPRATPSSRENPFGVEHAEKLGVRPVRPVTRTQERAR